MVVGDRTIDVHIRKLRDKLKLKRIVTVKGIGYKFIEKNQVFRASVGRENFCAHQKENTGDILQSMLSCL